MEADWSAEIGDGVPRIHAPWPGFVDLTGLDAIAVGERITEAAAQPALAAALSSLNAAASPVRTAKCDVWTLAAEEIDPYEFDCDAAEAACGVAAYIDILPRDPLLLRSFPLVEFWARAIARSLSPVPLPQARAEVVLRAAYLADAEGYALTLYAFGCGAALPAAMHAWEQALAAAAAATIATIPNSAGE